MGPFVEADSLAALIEGRATPVGRLTVRHYDNPHVMSPAMAGDITTPIDADIVGGNERNESWSR